MKLEKWHLLAVGVLFLALASLIFLTENPRSTASLPETIVREALAPLQGALSAVSQSISNAYATVTSIGRLNDENEELKREVAALRARLRAADELRHENALLRSLLELEDRVAPTAVTARVIARPSDNWFDTITINRGSRAGLRAGLPVISEDGVVGQIANVTPNTAQVILMVDAKSAVGGIVADSDTPVIVEGMSEPTGRLARVRPLVRDGALSLGSEVVTSGSSVFPRGIPIGRIVDVQLDPAGLHHRATLAPFADLGRLNWVMVLLDTEGDVEWLSILGDSESFEAKSSGAEPEAEAAP